MRDTKFGIPIILGLVIATIGIVAPILWDQYKSRSSLELKYVSFTTLIKKIDRLEELTIVYDGKPLDQISSTEFILLNSGRTPIVESDLISPPEITFPTDIEILDVRTETLNPMNLEVNISQIESTNAIAITFPLLNPGDYVHFSVLTDSSSISFDATARIVGIGDLIVVQEAQATQAVERKIPSSVYLVGFFSGISLFAVFIGTGLAIKERRVKTALRTGSLKMPASGSPQIYLDFLNTQLSWTTSKERKPLIEFLNEVPEQRPLTTEEKEQLEGSFKHAVDSAVTNMPFAIFFLIIASGGIAYIVSQLL